jgi:hypothetical protein
MHYVALYSDWTSQAYSPISDQTYDLCRHWKSMQASQNRLTRNSLTEPIKRDRMSRVEPLRRLSSKPVFRTFPIE